MIQAFNTETQHWEHYRTTNLAEKQALIKRLQAGPYVSINVDGWWW